MLEQILFEVG